MSDLLQRERPVPGSVDQEFVDERDIQLVQPGDLAGFTRCHFFAGIAGWELALRLAGWSEEREVWTGSCPCQPFSGAGKRKGTDDPRHLWPEWYRLIKKCRPATIFGEQVASKAGRAWLAGVFADLEAVGYAVAGADLCAAGIGAPHIRQRLWWVGYSASERFGEAGRDSKQPEKRSSSPSATFWNQSIPIPCLDGKARKPKPQVEVAGSNSYCGVGDSPSSTRQRHSREVFREKVEISREGEQDGNCSVRSEYASSGLDPWADAGFIPCLDGKARRIEPGLSPLVDGVPNRVGKLRAYGNAIVPQVAAEFIRAFLEAEASLT